MDFFTSMNVSAAGLSVQRTRINVTSSNIANIETTRTPEGGPYLRRDVVVGAVPFSQTFEGIVESDLNYQTHSAQVINVEADKAEPRLIYNPEHPDARPDGYVACLILIPLLKW